MLNSEIGNKIYFLRMLRGMSLERLSRASSTSKSYLWDLENKTSTNPTIEKISCIAKALDVKPEYLTNDGIEWSSEISNEAFFNKFNKMSRCNQNKVIAIVDIIIGE